MVSLSRIYTRTGDRGTTRLGNGREIAKTDPRVEANGSVDELNAVVGLAVTAATGQDDLSRLLLSVQNDLFDLGADLCVPEENAKFGEEAAKVLRITAGHVERLERSIDRYNENLESLKSFVLPGGCPLSAWLHLARTVCRRAERQCWRLVTVESLNEHALKYLNRVSDLFFVLARFANASGGGDVLWRPGHGQSEDG